MTNFRNMVAISATAACVAISQNADAQSDQLENLLDEKPAESADTTAESETSPTDNAATDDAATDDAATDGAAKPAAAKPAAESSEADEAELISAMEETAKLEIRSFELQAEREIDAAVKCEQDAEYLEMVRHYALASKLLNDSPKNAKKRKDCEAGIAKGLFAAAVQEYNTGRRERAFKLINKAIEHRHPKARRQLEAWNAAGDPDANKPDLSEITHERNTDEYKTVRERTNKHLKRARQFLATNQLKRALDECELVLVDEEYNREALLLRDQIELKRQTMAQTERKAARDGYIADVDEAWRPVYAINAREVAKVDKNTQKTPLDPTDPERAQEQSIIKRMKEMKLPAISFKPPTTIIEAVEFFRMASKDFDRPELPIEQRGFNFVLKTPEALHSVAAPVAESDDGGFSEEAAEPASPAQAGVPVIQMISASDISFYDALKLVCEQVEYKFTVKGPIVMVMHKNASIEEMVTRSYPVLSTFIDRMDVATEDLRSMGGSGSPFGASTESSEGEESKEKDWKGFFELLGVKWPEGSSIMYIKTIGKLRVRNTYENLAELEQALTEMNADPKLIEIETRFVEVCQEDLNSLGFEWILNSDYTLNLGSHVSRALGLRNGVFGERVDTTASSSTESGSITVGGVTTPVTGGAAAGGSSINRYASSSGASWIRGDGSHRNIGINAFGGTSDYTTGQRYLSTLSNHISGEGRSTNDQFMRVNAFLGAADLSVILHMLSQRSDTDLLSAPKVLTTSGQEAVMKVVTEYIYPTDYDVQLQSSSSGGGNNSGSSQSAILAVVEPQSFTMREVGVILDVTPTLTDDGNLIDLDLNTQVVDEPTWKNYGMRIPFTGNSSLQSFEGIGGIFEGLTGILTTLGTGLSDTLKASFAETAVASATTALDNLTRTSSDNMTYYDAPMEQPFFHVRSVVSKVSVYPGATIVMGGLITEQRKAMDDKVPFLGDLPFVGRLFRSHAEQTTKRNLLIFVTTRLVDTQGRELRSRDEDIVGNEVVAAPSAEN